MTTTQTPERGTKPVLRYILAAAALIFGVATIKAGGDVLFFSAQARNAAGSYVPFVLWANFIGGFLYVMAGLFILLNSTQALRLSVIIAAMTFTVLIAFLIHIAVGGTYETRTLAAMVFRSVVWVAIVLILRSKKNIGEKK
ncbi:MAG: hypothetical protein U1F27_13930 [Turneriella sp.]